MKIYILTSDKNIKYVEGLQYCVNKYWNPNPNVVLLGYKEPLFKLDKNFKFVSLGEDRGAGKACDDIIKFFSKIPDKHFIFSVDDFYPIREVKTNILDYLTDKMINEDISRIALTDQISSKGHEIIESFVNPNDSNDHFDTIEMGQSANYRKSAVWSMWTKDYFLKYFTNDMSLWSWELDNKCKDDGHRIIGTNNKYIIQSCHLFKRGSLKADWFKDSESSDVMFDEDKSIILDIIHS